MHFKPLPILLAVTILGCPVWCGEVVCASAGNGGAVAMEQHGGCCLPDDSETSTEHDSHPAAPQDDKPCRDCQCVCVGAVFDVRDVPVAPSLEVSPGFASVVSEAYPAICSATHLRVHHPPDVGVAPGRLLCLLHMSLLI